MINGKKGDGIVPAADTSKNSGIPARVWAALIAVCVANVAGHLAVLPSLPAQIPVHWGADGTVNGWGPSWTVAALGFLPLVLLATLWLVPRIDPKGAAYAKSGRFYLGFVIAFTVFMCGMTWLSELTVWGVVPQTGAVGIIVTTAIGVLFIGMGNYLPRVRQNYTMGVKTPWALADPENWRRTQRFGGKCFVVMGAGFIAFGFTASALPDGAAAAGIAAIALIPMAAMYLYSYLIWRKAGGR
ncbi:SdpI family protein [Paratractidigestivibacter sp.]|uniref:SdpI family protein n=1 Tax=Paratractidigestivibacter sp. TaxID=2847316 RepID=UPI003A90C74B